MTQKSLESLPIDIHYNKLLDWLVNRRHCTQQCQAILTVIRDKVSKAKESSLAEESNNQQIQELLALPQLNYFHVKQVFESLKSTDTGKKNYIGQYASQSMKNWADIIKLYEKDGTYLAEAALLITRNVNYEVPAVKKQISKCQQTQKECARKEKEYAANSADLRKQYAASCKQLGIEGEKIKTELASLVKDLPSELSKFAESAKSLNDAVQYYDKFTKFVTNNNDAINVPLLKHILSKGNTTTYEWRIGKAPKQIDQQDISIDLADEQDAGANGADGAIDWSAVDEDSAIDFGDAVNFDLGDITVESGGVLAVDGEVVLENPDIDAIDWGAVEDLPSAAAGQQTDDSGTATGKNALSIIDNPETRNNFIDDLLELKAFLTQRVNELSHDASDSHMLSAPSDIHLGQNEVTNMLTKVKDILDKLTSVQMQHLMLIRDSPRYVDRLRDSLRQKLLLADKMLQSEKEMAGTRIEAVNEEKDLEPQLELLRKQTKVLKKQLEDEISKKYTDRKVNIIGEINTI
ncbi:CDK5 regulatory subunit-associated protein 3-like [Physella acuta]|uniref:CDK5 regulatory subunit-associated protein 3-like n=1 Tax=Physella acuta TaxID=109671 RepID=UPI0027DD8794|nr:CDK5 regulatory subunit-associated protein 3-like [Physella acuta]XP_059151212.1 CDK5 regulatory subunit-associated protein 3-like [Physella acuta]